jgi:hypothetical protein
MNPKEIAFWVMILVVIGLGIYLVNYIKSESYECMNNPYVYSIKLLEEANHGNVSCMCTVPNSQTGIALTRDGFKMPLV